MKTITFIFFNNNMEYACIPELNSITGISNVKFCLKWSSKTEKYGHMYTYKYSCLIDRDSNPWKIIPEQNAKHHIYLYYAYKTHEWGLWTNFDGEFISVKIDIALKHIEVSSGPFVLE